MYKINDEMIDKFNRKYGCRLNVYHACLLEYIKKNNAWVDIKLYEDLQKHKVIATGFFYYIPFDDIIKDNPILFLSADELRYMISYLIEVGLLEGKDEYYRLTELYYNELDNES